MTRTPNVSAMLDRTPGANVSIINLNNGSYMITYFAQKSGSNLLSILIEGQHIKGSPFSVPIEDAPVADHDYSVARGRGLFVGIVGEPSYFEVFAYDAHGNRRTTSGDNFTYSVTGINNITGNLQPCPKPPSSISGSSE